MFVTHDTDHAEPLIGPVPDGHLHRTKIAVVACTDDADFGFLPLLRRGCGAAGDGEIAIDMPCDELNGCWRRFQFCASFSSCLRPTLVNDYNFAVRLFFPHLPLPFEPPLLFALVQSGMERTGAHLQHITRHLLEADTNRESVYRFPSNDFQEQHVQRASNQIGRLLIPVTSVTESTVSSAPLG
jgi:hypothetical protein